MRNNEERVAAMHKRAAEIKIEKRHRYTRILSVASVTACFALVMAFAVGMPGMNREVDMEQIAGMSGSLFTENGMLGFIVVGMVAFLLGVSVTVFCFRLRKWQEVKDRRDKEEEG